MFKPNLDANLPQRDEMEFDVVIVGAGPAGLAAAIRLKQLDPNISIIVLEKASEIGGHILSGAVIDPVGLDQLLPGWQEKQPAFLAKVQIDEYIYLTKDRAFKTPNWLLPNYILNEGNFVGSLGQVVRWLAQQAEALGVEIYPGFAGVELLYNEEGAVVGVATGDMGLDKEGNFISGSSVRGMALKAKYTLLAEGARGYLSQQAIKNFKLDSKAQPSKFSLGFKELWQIEPSKHQLGKIQHFIGWPLDRHTNGGGFIYHMADGKLAVGLVVHLDYRNPTLSLFDEFQLFKQHPVIRPLLKDGRRLSYGARTISEGGWQSVPRLTFPGGALLGCTAGLVNVARIKGSHNAILSAMQAAETVFSALKNGHSQTELIEYEEGWRASLIGKDLYVARNFKPLLERFGNFWGSALGLFDISVQQTLNLSLFGTLKHRLFDDSSLLPSEKGKIKKYPQPDNIVSFDKAASIALAYPNYSKNQPNHLKVKDLDKQYRSEYLQYGGPSQFYCPAAVYEWVQSNNTMRYIINAENCIQCKSCDIKDPNNNIEWTPPQGGDGPCYKEM